MPNGYMLIYPVQPATRLPSYVLSYVPGYLATLRLRVWSRTFCFPYVGHASNALR
jgi:hypothetical protein